MPFVVCLSLSLSVSLYFSLFISLYLSRYICLIILLMIASNPVRALLLWKYSVLTKANNVGWMSSSCSWNSQTFHHAETNFLHTFISPGYHLWWQSICTMSAVSPDCLVKIKILTQYNLSYPWLELWSLIQVLYFILNFKWILVGKNILPSSVQSSSVPVKLSWD